MKSNMKKLKKKKQMNNSKSELVIKKVKKNPSL